MASASSKAVGAIVAIIVIAALGYMVMGGKKTTTPLTTIATSPTQAPATTGTSPTTVSPATSPTPTTTVKTLQEKGAGLPQEIPIGLAIAVSKGYAVDGPRRLKAAKLAIEEMNELLEKAGAPFRFKWIHEDTEANPQKAVDVVKRFISDGIKVIVGPLSTSETAAVMPVANQHKVVVISPSSTGKAAAYPDDFVFRVAPPDTKQGPAIAEIIWKMGYTKLVIIARNDDYGKGLADLVGSTFSKLGGKVEKILYQPDKPDLSAEVTQLATKVQSFGADEKTAVLVIAFDNDGLQILQKSANVPVLAKVRWFGPDSMARKTFLENEKAASFLVKVKFLGTKPAIARNPVTKHFEEAYKKKYGESPTPYAYYSYDAAWLAMLSILAAGKYDGEAVKAVLPTIGMHFMGATGQKMFDKNGDAALADYTLWTVKATPEGKYEFKDVGVWHGATGTLEWFK